MLLKLTMSLYYNADDVDEFHSVLYSYLIPKCEAKLTAKNAKVKMEEVYYFIFHCLQALSRLCAIVNCVTEQQLTVIPANLHLHRVTSQS